MRLISRRVRASETTSGEYVEAFEPGEGHRLLGRRGFVVAGALAGVGIAAGGGWALANRGQPPATATLAVISEPPGATVMVDERARGLTPLTVAVIPGTREVALRLAGRDGVLLAVEAREAETTVARIELWPAAPAARRIRPPLPGATIANVAFLAGGRLALLVALPGGQRQAWLDDGAGAQRRIGPGALPGTASVDPAGVQLAYATRPPYAPGRPVPAPGDPRGLTEIWIGRADGAGEPGERRWAVPDTGDIAEEYVADLAWSPAGDELLVATTGRGAGGATICRLSWLDPARGEARELGTSPGEVAPGSHSWRPGGGRVAILLRGNGRTALCLLGRGGDDGGSPFRYLADLTGEDNALLPFAPVAWAPDGRYFAYAAPLEPAPRTATGSGRAYALYLADDGATVIARRADLGGVGPCWRGDGALLTIARPRTSQPPILRRCGPAPGGRAIDAPIYDSAPLPLPFANPVGARWDPSRARAIVATRGGGASGNPLEFWLLDWRNT